MLLNNNKDTDSYPRQECSTFSSYMFELESMKWVERYELKHKLLYCKCCSNLLLPQNYKRSQLNQINGGLCLSIFLRAPDSFHEILFFACQPLSCIHFFSVPIEPRSPTHLVLNLQSQVFVSSLEVLNSKDICGTSVYFLPHRLPECFLYAYSKQLFVQGRNLYTKTSFDSVQATPAEMCTTLDEEAALSIRCRRQSLALEIKITRNARKL